MPGSVANAAPSTIFPVSLSAGFVHSREYPMVENQYRNGESQRQRLADTNRKSWRIRKRHMKQTDWEALQAFWTARRGPSQPFYFYDPWETSPKFTMTPSGTTGRYTVRFDGVWQQSVNRNSVEVEISIIELA